MASLTEIRNALAQIIIDNVETHVNVYSLVEDQGRLPAVMIEPVEVDYIESMQRGQDTWDFNIFVLVGRSGTTSGAQGLLDTLVASRGPNSIPDAINSNPTLGLDDSVDAIVYQLKGYGGKFDWQANKHVGAVLKLRVITDGRETSA